MNNAKGGIEDEQCVGENRCVHCEKESKGNETKKKQSDKMRKQSGKYLQDDISVVCDWV